MDHGKYAVELFLQGYNCAQAVAEAFCDVTGLDEKTAARMASSFGGGMGRMREICGAVSGMLLVYGLLHGYDVPGDDISKKATPHRHGFGNMKGNCCLKFNYAYVTCLSLWERCPRRGAERAS